MLSLSITLWGSDLSLYTAVCSIQLHWLDIFSLLTAVKWCPSLHWERWKFTSCLSSLSGRIYAVMLCRLLMLLCYLVYTKSAQINATSKREEDNFFFNAHPLSKTMHINCHVHYMIRIQPMWMHRGNNRHPPYLLGPRFPGSADISLDSLM